MSFSFIPRVCKVSGADAERFVVSLYDTILGRIVETTAEITEDQVRAKLCLLSVEEQDAHLRIARRQFTEAPRI